MLKIVTVPHPVLSSEAETVAVFDGSISKLIREMAETLNDQIDPEGVGLAAPQVGISKAIFIIKPKEKGKPKAFINPRILESEVAIEEKETGKKKKKGKKRIKLEGCLSIGRIWGTVKRNNKILLEYQDQKGVKKKGWFLGFEAVIIQHEVDHLKGVLFTQRVLEQGGSLYEEKDGELKKMRY